MNNYEVRVFPKLAEDGSTYWTAYYPSIPDCIGGGDTVEEAICEAKENLELYLEFLKEECRKIPEDDYQSEHSGKIALRIPKGLHKRLAETAEREGVSVNLLINNALENYMGLKAYDMNINKKIDDLKDIAKFGCNLQIFNADANKKMWNEVKGCSRGGVLWKNVM